VPSDCKLDNQRFAAVFYCCESLIGAADAFIYFVLSFGYVHP
jgi:hypothetical protein